MKSELKQLALLTLLTVTSSLTGYAQFFLDVNYGVNLEDQFDEVEYVDAFAVHPYDSGTQVVLANLSSSFNEAGVPAICWINQDGFNAAYNDDGIFFPPGSNDKIMIAGTSTNQWLFEWSDPNENIVIAYQGFSNNEADNSLHLLMLDGTGTPQEDWGADGWVSYLPPNVDLYDYEYHALSSHVNGAEFVVTGIRRSPVSCDEVFAIGFSDAGTIDNSFGQNGFALLDINTIASGGQADCPYRIKQVNEKAGLLVANLEDANGAISLCFAFASPNGSLTTNTGLEIADDVNAEMIGQVVFADYPPLFEDNSRSLLSSTSLFGFVIPVYDEQPAVLYYNLLSQQLEKFLLDIPTDVVYTDMVTNVSATAENLYLHFVGERDEHVHLSALAICGGEATIVSQDFDIPVQSENGLLLSLQNREADGVFTYTLLAGYYADEMAYTMAKVDTNINCTITGIENSSSDASEFLVYPNPVNERQISIELFIEASNAIKISLNSICGRRVCDLARYANFDGKLSERFYLPDDVTPGIYCLQIILDDAHLTKKLVVR
jgi:hypothetical protein